MAGIPPCDQIKINIEMDAAIQVAAPWKLELDSKVRCLLQNHCSRRYHRFSDALQHLQDCINTVNEELIGLER